MADEQPAVHLSVHWPDTPGMPNSLDIDWAQDNPGSLIGVVQVLTAQILPLLTEPVRSATLEWDTKAKVVVPGVPCDRVTCGHGHDRHGQLNADGRHSNSADPNGGACVVCNDGRLCASYVPLPGKKAAG